MSDYYGKVLELIDINITNDETYLHIHLFNNQERFEFFWKIDRDTANNLQEVIDFDDKHKYRLALHMATKPTDLHSVGLVTKTYLDLSEKIYFECSVDYKNALEIFNCFESIDDLSNHPIFYTQLSSEQEKNQPRTDNLEKSVSSIHNPSLKWVRVAIPCVLIFTIIFFINYQPWIQASVNKTDTIDVKTITTKAILEKDKHIEKITPKVAATQSISQVPTIKISESKTFSLPEGTVALTFDDGPSKYTKEIADILTKYEAGGTFFFIGVNTKKYPDSVQYVHSNGFSIGSHSMTHPNLASLTFNDQIAEIQQSTRVIEEIINDEVILFRPPYEAFNEETEKIIQENNYRMILWNQDPEDWKTRDADKIYHYIHGIEASGSIILLHESQAVIDALPRILEHLNKQGLKIVNLK